MKKLLLIIFVSFMAICLFASCSKDDTGADALSETIWTSKVYDDYGKAVTMYLMFQSNHRVTLSANKTTIAGLYTYHEPYVDVTFTTDGLEGTLHGLIMGNTMLLSDDVQAMTFEKQN